MTEDEDVGRHSKSVKLYKASREYEMYKTGGLAAGAGAGAAKYSSRVANPHAAASVASTGSASRDSLFAFGDEESGDGLGSAGDYKYANAAGNMSGRGAKAGAVAGIVAAGTMAMAGRRSADEGNVNASSASRDLEYGSAGLSSDAQRTKSKRSILSKVKSRLGKDIIISESSNSRSVPLMNADEKNVANGLAGSRVSNGTYQPQEAMKSSSHSAGNRNGAAAAALGVAAAVGAGVVGAGVAKATTSKKVATSSRSAFTSSGAIHGTDVVVVGGNGYWEIVETSDGTFKKIYSSFMNSADDSMQAGRQVHTENVTTVDGSVRTVESIYIHSLDYNVVAYDRDGYWMIIKTEVGNHRRVYCRYGTSEPLEFADDGGKGYWEWVKSKDGKTKKVFRNGTDFVDVGDGFKEKVLSPEGRVKTVCRKYVNESYERSTVMSDTKDGLTKEGEANKSVPLGVTGAALAGAAGIGASGVVSAVSGEKSKSGPPRSAVVVDTPCRPCRGRGRTRNVVKDEQVSLA
uniref:Uncharacterized protein n=1 Tax=Grammatophora oceanica TaxID=210454 RepID=A0A7S1VQK7_9STRA